MAMDPVAWREQGARKCPSAAFNIHHEQSPAFTIHSPMKWIALNVLPTQFSDHFRQLPFVAQ
jgi:hypothetical protein